MQSLSIESPSPAPPSCRKLIAKPSPSCSELLKDRKYGALSQKSNRARAPSAHTKGLPTGSGFGLASESFFIACQIRVSSSSSSALSWVLQVARVSQFYPQLRKEKIRSSFDNAQYNVDSDKFLASFRVRIASISSISIWSKAMDL